MNDAALVGCFEGLRDLLGDGEGFVDWDRSLLDAIRQRRPLDEFEDQRLNALGFLQPLDTPNVRMVQRGQHLRFALESRQAVGVGSERFR